MAVAGREVPAQRHADGVIVTTAPELPIRHIRNPIYLYTYNLTLWHGQRARDEAIQ
jgi:hypothetical protein